MHWYVGTKNKLKQLILSSYSITHRYNMKENMSLLDYFTTNRIVQPKIQIIWQISADAHVSFTSHQYFILVSKPSVPFITPKI